MTIEQSKIKKLKKIPKPLAIGAVWVIALILMLVIGFHHNPLAPDQHTEFLKKFCACILLSAACLLVTIYYDRLLILPAELFQSRHLIWKLAKNDFKKRYAGSYLGIVWALIQPVVTVVMYWIVFDRVFQTRSQLIASGIEVPYVLYLTAGLVPWFFFNEAIVHGTMALLEYS